MAWAEAQYYWSLMPRGTIVNDSDANIWRILSCDITRNEATIGTLHYVMESISFDTPPDDFQINETSLDLNIIKHPRYAWALNPYVTDASTYAVVGDTKIYYQQQKETIIRQIQLYVDSPVYPTAAYLDGQIQAAIKAMVDNGSAGVTTPGKIIISYPNSAFDGSQPPVPDVTWDGTNANLPTVNCANFIMAVPFNTGDPTDPITIAIAAAKELISKLWRQEDAPYIAGWEIVWTQYFFAPVYLNPGGYIEDPRNVVPSYFLDPFNNGVIPRSTTNGDGFPEYATDPFTGQQSLPAGANSTSIFDQLTYINPQCYSADGTYGGDLQMSCLRKSDHVEYERTWFKYPHTWLCAPIGKWDADIYTQNDRPQISTDYNQLPNQF